MLAQNMKYLLLKLNLTLFKNISSFRILCIQNGSSKKGIKREQIFLMSHICSLIHINSLLATLATVFQIFLL